MTADILVPELGAPDEAEQTFKSNLADKANQNTKDIAQTSQDISTLADRVTALEDSAGELEVTVKKYFNTDLITPFESDFDFVDVICMFDAEFASTPAYYFFLCDETGDQGNPNTLSVFNVIASSYDGSGSGPFAISASIPREKLPNGRVGLAYAQLSGTVTVSNVNWIVRRYRIL